MDSIRNHNYEEQNEQPGSGLLRFRSAPSSFMVNFADNVANNESGSDFHQEFEGKSSAVRVREGAVGYTNSPQGYSGLPPHYPRQTSAASTSAMDGSYGLIGSLGMAHHGQLKSADSGLARQSSSPPGLFALHQHGYGGMRIVGTYAGMDGTNIEVSPRLKSQFSLSPRVPSSLGMLSQISEIDSESIGASSPDNGKPGNGAGDGRFYSSSGFPYSSWSESHFPANFNGTKRDQENTEKLFSSTQQGEIGSRVNVLSHHLSLPKSSAEMAAVEKMLHFQDSVPCKIRAKRGCATHPRSIAERLRRTRISERMRKLQELVPNMDKQTNTADMLDLAVDYIKELQKQYKTLCDNRANCKCISKQKPVQNQIV